MRRKRACASPPVKHRPVCDAIYDSVTGRKAGDRKGLAALWRIVDTFRQEKASFAVPLPEIRHKFLILALQTPLSGQIFHVVREFVGQGVI